MKKLTKRERLIQEKVDLVKLHELTEAIGLLKEVKATKFDETVEVALRLGVDPRKADQMVRGTCALPHGLGKEVRVLVFAKGEKVKEAEDAGADLVGGEEFAQQIQGGWLEFDRCVATPDMMAVVGKIGKILGPRGLMPNPKVGTVTFDVGAVVQSIKSGQVEFRVDKSGNLQAPVGKISFDPEKLEENVSALLDAVKRLKPSTSKGIYLRGCTLSSSMGPGLKVDPQAA
ncbi:MAG: 50S ribosomal protein L1 [SAR324 cluster bacterium]|jgi:large subunit ribosomal protein L1|nr:50S ribosomal protein L1 [Deltaproteobacteria bacterium]MDE0906678.1 50S ribosomal protein L1 [SAR324 cluster bacterium]HIF68555.1 50S ribosomal protein L1 [Candidatus Lambdaproteobacteria bacterium]MEC7417876.1 50S ribosomal protein L1 [SAR324 cluster bacterium]HBI28253.1 50S ribosomal protein L1 [Deltaproteobacteria bacterium]|tara:strand:- start:1075 stop:1764 length:690 start_codon:yes stop_codon:yes gene_type:complete